MQWVAAHNLPLQTKKNTRSCNTLTGGGVKVGSVSEENMQQKFKEEEKFSSFNSTNLYIPWKENIEKKYEAIRAATRISV